MIALDGSAWQQHVEQFDRDGSSSVCEAATLLDKRNCIAPSLGLLISAPLFRFASNHTLVKIYLLVLRLVVAVV